MKFELGCFDQTYGWFFSGRARQAYTFEEWHTLYSVRGGGADRENHDPGDEDQNARFA